MVVHLSDESIAECPLCNMSGKLKKLVTSFTTTKTKVAIKTKTGQITEDFIESAKEDLMKQKDDMKKDS